MKPTIVSHAVVAGASALLASGLTYVVLGGSPSAFSREARAQDKPPAQSTTRQVELVNTKMDDVLGRVFSMRRFERDPGASSPPHRHPGSHTFGYVLEGVYEVQVDNGPLQRLGPGETFYEPPGALHAVSRNGSSTQPVKYLVIQVSDPTKPGTVPEKP